MRTIVSAAPGTLAKRLAVAIAQNGGNVGSGSFASRLQELARKSGVGLGTLRHWLTGTMPGDVELRRVCEVLRVNPAWMRTGDRTLPLTWGEAMASR
jgi:Helix-turn-helix